jgi:hypothetical protein
MWNFGSRNVARIDKMKALENRFNLEPLQTQNAEDQLPENDRARSSECFRTEMKNTKTKKANTNDYTNAKTVSDQPDTALKNMAIVSSILNGEVETSQTGNSAQTHVVEASNSTRKARTAVALPIGQTHAKLGGRSNILNRAQISYNELLFAMIQGVVQPCDFKVPKNAMTCPQARANVKLDVRMIPVLREMYDCWHNEQVKTRVQRNSPLVIPDRPEELNQPEPTFVVSVSDSNDDPPTDYDNSEQLLIDDGVVIREFGKTADGYEPEPHAETSLEVVVADVLEKVDRLAKRQAGFCDHFREQMATANDNIEELKKHVCQIETFHDDENMQTADRVWAVEESVAEMQDTLESIGKLTARFSAEDKEADNG